MLYICIPVHNEGPTVGVLLWRIRTVFQEFSREYEVLVYDDASTDQTAETLEPYARVLPLTVVRGETRQGYAHALEQLCRLAAKRTRYPRRDAMVVMQGDFTDRPEHLPELVKMFEGGADVVVAEGGAAAGEPQAVTRLRKVAPWVLRPFVRVPGVREPFRTLRLMRIGVVRDALKAAGDGPLLSSGGWAANVELLLRMLPHARRVDAVALDARYDVRPRESRVRPLADAMNLFRFGREARRLPVRTAPAEPAASPAAAPAR